MRVWKWLALLVFLLAPGAAWAKKPIVEFDISVDGARLLIDGKVKLPSAGRKERFPIPEGTHTVRVEREGYTIFEQTFDVDADAAPAVIHAILKPGPGARPSDVPKKPREPRKPKEKKDKKEKNNDEEEQEAQKEPPPRPEPRPPDESLPAAPEAKPESPARPEKDVVTFGEPPPPTTHAPQQSQYQSNAPIITAPKLPPPPPYVPPPTREKNPPVTVAVMEYAGFDLDARVSIAVSDAVAAEIRKRDRVTAIGARDYHKLLSRQQLDDFLACSDYKCQAAIGVSLGVDEIVLPELKQDDSGLHLLMRRLDVATVSEIGSASAVVKGIGLAVVTGIGPDVEKLYADYALRPGMKSGMEPDAIRNRLRPPPPLPPAAFITTATFAGAALLVGLGTGLDFTFAQAEYTNLASHTHEQPVSAATLKTLGSRVQTEAAITNAALISGGVLAVASVVELALTDWKGVSRQVAAPVLQDPGLDPVSLRLTPGGLMVSWR